MAIEVFLTEIYGRYSVDIARKLTLVTAWELLRLRQKYNATACYLVESRSVENGEDKMLIQQITYQKVVNLGNFNSHRFEATATVVHDEDVYESARLLQQFVNWSLKTAEGNQEDSQKIDYDSF